MLAGVSVPYYTRLERGDINGVSDSVLDALARALQLDEAERAHLFDLARAAQPPSPTRRRRPAKQRVRPSVQHILDAMTGAAALVRNDRLDILAGNQLGRALYSDMFADPGPAGEHRPVRLPRPARPRLLPRLGRARPSDVVAVLRTAAGRDPYDRDLSDLVGELSTRARVPHPLGRPQRPLPPHRHQALPPPRRRRHHHHLQPHGTRAPIPAWRS